MPTVEYGDEPSDCLCRFASQLDALVGEYEFDTRMGVHRGKARLVGGAKHVRPLGLAKRMPGHTQCPCYFDQLLEAAVRSLTRLIECSRRLHEKGADLHRLRQYVQRWVTWLHGGLHGAVTENRFNQIWNYVNIKLSG